jgi:hypothetical protein
MAKSFKFDGLLKEAEKQKAEADRVLNNSESFIKQNIIIKEEFKFLIPPLAPDEYEKLEQSILAEGCRDPLVIWKKDNEFILIDGHNRFGICTKHDLEYKIQIMDFESAEKATDWIINNQLGKRNVSDETKSYLRGQQYNREKKKEANIQNLKQFSEEDNLSYSGNTAERLAQIHKVSEKTIKRDEKYAIAVDKLCGDNKGLKWDILHKRIVLPKGGVMNLADESDDFVQKIGEMLTQGYSFNQAIQMLNPKEKEDIEDSPRKEKLRKLKTNIINSIEEIIKTEDVEYIEELKNLILEFESTLKTA